MKKLISAYFILIALTACNKEYSETFVPYPDNALNDTTWRPTISSSAPVNGITAMLSRPSIIDSFIASSNTILSYYNDSLKIYITPNSFVTTGNTTANGKLQITYKPIVKKGDYIRYAKATTSNNMLLESAATFYASVTQGGQELQLANNATIRFRYTQNYTSAIQYNFFLNDASTTNYNNWVGNTLTNNNGYVNPWTDMNGSQQVKGYDVYSKKTTWVACGNYIDSLGVLPSTRINVILPLNFTNNNTAVYAVFKNKNVVARLTADYNSRSFYVPNIPTGTDVILIAVSKIGNDIYFGNKELLANSSTMTNLSVNSSTIADVGAFLDNL